MLVKLSKILGMLLADLYSLEALEIYCSYMEMVPERSNYQDYMLLKSPNFWVGRVNPWGIALEHQILGKNP